MAEKPERVGTGAAPDHSSDVLERVSDGVVALDRNWRYTYVNSRAAGLFGRRPEELIGRHIWTEFPEGRGQPFHLAYEKAMAEQVFIEMENYYEPWDRWFENRIYPSANGVSIFFHEITERKQAEQAARENAALLKGQNQVLELIAQREPLQHTLDVLLRLIEAQCPGMLCSILLLDSDGIHVRHGAAPSLPEAFIRAVDGQPIGPRAGSCGTAAFRREPVVVEDIATDPLWDDYREFALAHGLRACWSTPIVDEERRVMGTFALYFRAPGRPTNHHLRLIDLSTHTAAIAIAKHRETQALHASEERLRLAVTHGNVGIWEWIVGTDCLELSDQLKALLGWRVEMPLTKKTFLEAIQSDDRAAVSAALERSLAERGTFDAEFRIPRTQSPRWIAITGRAEYDAAGQPVRMMGVARDITKRKQALEILEQRVATRTAELREKNRELEDEVTHRQRVAELLRNRNEELKAFAYTVSHDLKAPLRGIAGYAQELNRGHRAGLDDRGVWCIEHIVTAAQNLDRLIEDLLHYSRLDAEAPSSTTVDLARMLDGILTDRKAVMLGQGVEVNVTLDATSVHTWERGLFQVLANLIDNAIKYSRDAKPPRIQIASHNGADVTRIVVADNGIGFDMKFHDRIFGLFNRLVRQEDFDGTGAGLAIVKKIVDKVGGKVWAESKPGAGASFFVELPAMSGSWLLTNVPRFPDGRTR